MSERSYIEVQGMIALIVNPSEALTDPDEMEDFRSEFWQFSGGYKLPKEMGADAIRVAAAYILECYSHSGLINGTVDEILKDHLKATKGEYES